MDSTWIIRVQLLLGILWAKNVYSQIPSSMLKKVALMNTTEFLSTMVLRNMNRSASEKDPLEDVLFRKEGGVDEIGVRIVSSRLPATDECSPRMSVVELPSPNVRDMYYPSCVLLPRCGGCCTGEVLKCGPKEAETETITVLLLRYPHAGASHFEFVGNKELSLEVHSKCECKCKTQPYHCKSYHTYSEEECRCKCKDTSAQSKCNFPRFWNNHKCECACPMPKEPCIFGESFNPETCTCETIGAPTTTTTRRPFNPCNRKTCSVGYEPRVDGFRCRCELVSNLPSRMTHRSTRSHITERFPLMRAGIFNRRR